MTKAYMSEVGIEGWGEVGRFAGSPNTGDVRADLASGAQAELAKILVETEGRAGSYYARAPYLASVPGWGPEGAMAMALRDALAALVADGGPLDELAWESATDAACADSADGIGDGLMLGVYLANAARYMEAR